MIGRDAERRAISRNPARAKADAVPHHANAAGMDGDLGSTG